MSAIFEPRIRKTPGVVGGDACIRKTRIAIWLLVAYRNHGLSDAELIAHFYPGAIDQDDLHAAWDYYEQNRDEIDEAIRANEEA